MDLAIVFVPAPQVPAAVESCAARGVRGVIIESGGFAETGPEGKRLQDRLSEIAARTGIRLWGPNCMGLVDCVHRRIFSFMDPQALERGEFIPGTVSLVVQSGMLSAIFLIDIMSNATMGVSKVCSLGNKVDVDECDVLEYFLDDPDTGVIGLYLESFSDGRRFLDLCRRSAKPIVVLKGGRSRQGAEAALSHTASLAGNQRIVTGALAQAGVTEARDFKQMMDLCRSLALMKPSAAGSDRVAVLTLSGGAGIVATDFVAEQGLAMADLSESTRQSLATLFPEWMPVSNPVDLWPAVERQIGDDLDVVRPLACGPPRRSGGGCRLSPCLYQQSPEPARTSPICPPRSGAPANRSSPGSSAGGTIPMPFRRRPWLTEFPSLRKSPAPRNAWPRSWRERRRPEPLIAEKADQPADARRPCSASSIRRRDPSTSSSRKRSSGPAAFRPFRK